jgi:hypothetical protein
MDFSAFSHGQMHSKIWLCEILEPYIKEQSKIAILGSWYNILGLMLNIRKPNYHNYIIGFDIDEDAIKIADSITESWRFYPKKILENIQADVNDIGLDYFDVIISTSVEHITENIWFDNIKSNTLVCIQSSTIGKDIESFLVTNENKSLSDLKNKYPLSKIVYEGELDFDYPVNPYKRLMIIGYK